MLVWLGQEKTNNLKNNKALKFEGKKGINKYFHACCNWSSDLSGEPELIYCSLSSYMKTKFKKKNKIHLASHITASGCLCSAEVIKNHIYLTYSDSVQKSQVTKHIYPSFIKNNKN